MNISDPEVPSTRVLLHYLMLEQQKLQNMRRSMGLDFFVERKELSCAEYEKLIDYALKGLRRYD